MSYKPPHPKRKRAARKLLHAVDRILAAAKDATKARRELQREAREVKRGR